MLVLGLLLLLLDGLLCSLLLLGLSLLLAGLLVLKLSSAFGGAPSLSGGLVRATTLFHVSIR